ncbi:hypothetical protein Kisp01_56400 [Kineosporia sp. NBRC 101677]|uniref:pilus assembly protein TadG-related protein n=1 Tax=Kineosporia sp. NBRC 101677 TaxID=3032197 RepID=UPI0024A0DCB9|nr:pilus assembly protein TadG-related protein [Kineosporia sp. NBRC 101677]GLY18626.1 hypothetical protein Kisp01_56400 [Kineosporia sp. NBRC 101677]
MRHEARSEAGVVAIVTTLAISTFLLGVAALAVDLGRAYLRQNDLQALADRLALAAAKGLPTIVEPEGAIDQLTTTLTAICTHREESGELCRSRTGIDPQQWTDGDPGNGEVTFFTDSDTDGRVGLADAVSDLSTPSQALRVLLPPTTVEFGLAGALGFEKASIQRSATARIGTPLGSGILPFALTPEEVTSGRFCVQEPETPPVTPLSTAPSTSGRYSATDVPAGTVRLRALSGEGIPVSGATASFRLAVYSLWQWPSDVRFRWKTPDGTTTPLPSERTGLRTFRITLPPGQAGSTAQLWATGRLYRDSFTTNVLNLTYAGTPPATDPPPTPGTCESSAPVVQLARQDTGDPATALENNVRSGPQVNLRPHSGTLVGGTLACVGSILTGSTDCLNLGTPSQFSESLRRGLLESGGGRPGRLIGDTGNGVESANGYQVDATSLFESPHLLDPRYTGGSSQSLRTLLAQGVAAGPANQGWITSAAVRSHRLAVVPVIDPEPLGLGNDYRITSFRYVWIDGDTSGRGLLWRNGRLTGLEGYVVDPGYLPAVTSGSATVGPFLGAGMPKEALLVADPDGARP